MITGIEGVSSAAPIDYARRIAEARKAFSIPESALRSESAGAAGGVATERDPVADSVELSRDFPQLLVNQTYAPPTEQLLGLMKSGQTDAALPREEGADAAAGTGAAVEGEAEDGEEDVEEAADPNAEKGADGQPLDENEQAQLRELKARDMEVRAHEQAHMAVGGSYAGAASYEYQQGPDGGRYAVGGEVSIDVSAETAPEDTIAKMLVVKAAAMAPAEPSPQDYSVAAQATQTESEARQELSAAQAGEAAGAGEDGEAEAAEGADASENADGAGGANAFAGVGEDSEGGPSAMSGGTAALSSSSTNPFVNRYAESAYMAGNASRLAMSSYTPINIVA